MTLEQLHEQLKEGEVKDLNIIVKTDVSGTAEVLSDMMQKLSSEKVRIRVIRSGVGAINEGDVLLASTSNAIIIGFNVRPERDAATLAEQEKVDVRLHTIIYELTDEMKRAMTGMLEPVYKEVYKGRIQVREVFKISKIGNVAGCMVLDGTIARDCEVRLLRDNVVVYTGKIESLRRFKNDVMPSVGVLTLELHLPESHSLKDKRHTVKGLKDRLRSRHNVAVAEIDFQDTWQRSLISAVTVSSDRVRAEQVLQAVERDAVDFVGPNLVDVTLEWLD